MELENLEKGNVLKESIKNVKSRIELLSGGNDNKIRDYNKEIPEYITIRMWGNDASLHIGTKLSEKDEIKQLVSMLNQFYRNSLLSILKNELSRLEQELKEL